MVSVFTREIFPADVAIADGRIVGVGEYFGPHELDVTGKYLTPGFMDGHCHIESSKLSVHEFARAILASGTTTVVVDPHELANVLGVAGIRHVLEASEGLPLNIFVMLPSCVPASRFESPRAPLAAEDLAPLIEHRRVIGLAEMMNYPAAIDAEDDVLEKLALFRWRRIDGHAPGVSGRQLNAYLVAGPATDHECTTLQEALEKRRLGMWVMIREASMIRNLADLISLVEEHGTENTLFVTDDREVDTLLHEGHINAMVRSAVSAGLHPSDAVKLATLNVARCHGIQDLGGIAPGYRADICVLPNLESFVPEIVLTNGEIVVEDGRVGALPTYSIPDSVRDTVRLAEVVPSSFRLQTSSGRPTIRVVELVPDQVVTRSSTSEATVVDGSIVADPQRDLAKLAVVERHHASGRAGIGFVRGFGLNRGALASTVAHDAHNVVVVGVDDGDMAVAVTRLSELGGGLVVVDDGEIIAELDLPIAGLMSDRPAEEVDAAIQRLDDALGELGVKIATPFMYLGFLALSVIPELRVTDRGVVDVGRFEIVPLAV